MEPSDVRYCYTNPVIYLTLLPIYFAGSLFTHLLAGNPDDWYVLASHFGYGFRVTLPDGAKVLKPTPVHNESDLLAVVTVQGRLLIFPVTDLPALARGKGNKLIQIPPAVLAAGKDYVVATVD